MISSRFLPDERLGIFVPALGPGADRVLELIDRGERALLQATVGELGEPALVEIEPRRAGWRDVQVPPRALGMSEPLRHRFGLVRREVVEHDVDLEIAGHVQVDEAKEVEHLF